jgi:hypothetical protein
MPEKNKNAIKFCCDLMKRRRDWWRHLEIIKTLFLKKHKNKYINN